MTEKRESLSPPSPYPSSSSCMSNSETETEIGTKIVEYMCVGDEIYYDHHTFSLNIWNEREKLSYTIQRSYASFCEFHARLAKKYPKTTLPTIPFADYQRFSKLYEKSKSSRGSSITNSGNIDSKGMHQVGNGSNQSANDKITTRLSIITTQKTSDNRMKRKDTTSEVISQKRALLSSYLEELLRIPEVLMSEETSIFLDEESDDGLTLSHPQTSAVDISLLGEDPETKTILRSHEMVKDVESEGFVVAWSFRTKSRDIGFSVEFNGKSVVPYQRYDSHAHMVSGMISVPEKGQAKLVWDNTYSKLRSKVLIYRVRVVDAVEFETASRIADEKSKERQRLEQQRQLLKRIFSAHFKQLFATNGSIFSKITINDHKAIATDRLTAIYQDQEDEIRILREEKSELEHRISTLEIDLEAEKSDSQTLSESIEELEGIHEQSLKELQSIKEDNAEKSEALTAKKEQIDSLHGEMQLQQKRFSEEIADARNVEVLYAKSKAEKKQLKTYALQLKSQSDSWVEEKKGLESKVYELERELADQYHKEKMKESTNSPVVATIGSSNFPNFIESTVDSIPETSSNDKDVCNYGFSMFTSSWEQLLADHEKITATPHNGNSQSELLEKSSSGGGDNRRSSTAAPPSDKKVSGAQKLLLSHGPLPF